MNKLSTQSIAISYAQREKRRLIAINIICARGWLGDYNLSSYHSPVTYLRHRHGITWKYYYSAWGGIMYTKFGK